MRQIIILVAACALSFSALAKGGQSGSSHASGGSHTVRGHTTKTGQYVQPHHATNRDNTKSNNYSHKGNVNPYTGKPGNKD